MDLFVVVLKDVVTIACKRIYYLDGERRLDRDLDRPLLMPLACKFA